MCQVKKKYDDLLGRSGTEAVRASILAASISESGAWLRALPSQSLGLKLQNDHLRIAAALQVGAKICEKHMCICGKEADSYGNHALVCKRVPGCQLRHSELNGVISRALTSVQIPNRREPSGLVREDGKRSDGITLVPWEKGTSAVWDVTYVSSLAQSNIKKALDIPGGAAKGAEEARVGKDQTLGSSYIFIPIGFETLGTFGPSTKSFIGKLGKKLEETTGEPRSTQFLKERLSVTIQRGNAISISSTYIASNEFNEFSKIV